MRRPRNLLLCLTLAVISAASTGCVVPQPRGLGLYQHIQEPTTKAWYHLYLPVDYVRNQGRHPDPNVRKWPVVMTFHGMKPYDNALPQEREWEQQADVYGYVVCAPELQTSDSFMEYPLTKEHGYVLKDKRNVIAIMDHLFATTNADPKRVLATSWSCGGYLAHYFVNRFPDRFACLAPRLSNFSRKLMVEETVPRYRDRIPVALFIGDGDFPACKVESEEAVAWYLARNFRVAHGKMIDNMGHSRIPQTAAAFFAEHIGLRPLRPVEAASTLARIAMIDYQPPQDLIARMSPPLGLFVPGVAVARATPLPPVQREEQATDVSDALAAARPRNHGAGFGATSAGRNYPVGSTPTYNPAPSTAYDAGKNNSSPSVPPTGAAATRVADASKRNGNWLEPPTGPSTPKEARPTGSVPGSVNPPPNAAQQDRPASDRQNTEKPQTPVPAGSQSPPPRQAVPQPAPVQPQQSQETVRPPARNFEPKNAGRRDNSAWLAMAPPQPQPIQRTAAAEPIRLSSGEASGSPSTTAAHGPGGPPAAPAKATSPSAPRSPSSGSEELVTVKLSGPAVGRAPHWIGYSVDLPRSMTQGADFLWMDNGAWIGDEPRGVKILETPGMHKISVLVVAKNNNVYRGYATVQVLEPYPSGRISAMAD